MKSGSKLYLPRWRALGTFLLLLLGPARISLIAQPITAVADPPSARARLGSTATFCIAAQGIGTFSYQWQKNGVLLPNQTNQCITLTNIAIADGGSYRATVFNNTGALESEEATLTVVLSVLPGGDQFANSEPISVLSNTVVGTSFSATREISEPLHFNLRTSNSVWYVWRSPADGVITFDTQGSTFDTVLAVYTGSYLSSLTEVTSDDDSGGFHTSKVSWNAKTGTDYRIVIDGVTGETGTYVCRWNMERASGPIPVITKRPRSQTVLAGGTAVFEVGATDVDPKLKFQWFHNGTSIPGAISSNLTVLKVNTADLGQYFLSVTNSIGRGVVTTPVDLEIGPFPDVQSKDKLAEESNGGITGRALRLAAGGTPGTFSLAAGTIINQRFFNASTVDRCEPAHCGAPGGASRWFQLLADANGICTIDTRGSDVDTILAVYLQNFSICTNLYEPLVDCNNDALGTCDQILTANSPRERGSRLSFQATAGTIYRAVVDTVGGIRGTNIQFNVRFQSDESFRASEIQLGASQDQILQMRGSSMSLSIATNFTSPNTAYEWQVNGRRIAGAVRSRLLIPFLNYSDAGRYSVTLQSGNVRTNLPGAVVSVVDPCHSALPTTAEGLTTSFQLLGTSPESITLEAAGSFDPRPTWKVIGKIPASTEPTLWDVSTGLHRFYRLSQPPP